MFFVRILFFSLFQEASDFDPAASTPKPPSQRDYPLPMVPWRLHKNAFTPRQVVPSQIQQNNAQQENIQLPSDSKAPFGGWGLGGFAYLPPRSFNVQCVQFSFVFSNRRGGG